MQLTNIPPNSFHEEEKSTHVFDEIDYARGPTPLLRTKETLGTQFTKISHYDSIGMMDTLANLSIESGIQAENRRNSIESAKTVNYEHRSLEIPSYNTRNLKNESTLTKGNPLLFYDQESCSTEHDQVINSHITSPGHLSTFIEHFAYIEC